MNKDKIKEIIKILEQMRSKSIFFNGDDIHLLDVTSYAEAILALLPQVDGEELAKNPYMHTKIIRADCRFKDRLNIPCAYDWCVSEYGACPTVEVGCKSGCLACAFDEGCKAQLLADEIRHQK